MLSTCWAWLIVMTRFAIWSLARLSRSARRVLASREKSRKRPWPGLAYGKAASVGGHFIPNFTCCAFETCRRTVKSSG